MAEQGDWRKRFKRGGSAGLRKGWDAFVWMMKIIVPLSLFTSLLNWSGLMNHLDILLNPLMGALSLPPMAALPLLIGMLTGVYGGIAAMAVLPFTTAQMTLLAVFILMAHSLIQEGIIQGKSGIHPLKATAVRIGAAVATLLLIAPWVGSSPELPTAPAGALAVRPALTALLGDWAWTTFALSVKIFCIIMVLLTLLELLKAFDWILPLVRALSPLLRLMGLDEKMGLLWMTAVIFGLSYGGAMIVEEAKGGHLSPAELEILHLSIGMNHSLVEDPSLFLPFGIHPLWLYGPRLVMAIVTVRLVRLWQGLGHHRQAAV